MIKKLLIAASLVVPISTTYAQDVSTPAGGGTLPLGDELEASDGTLPLRLPSDGTLPLRLAGDAVSQGAGSRVNTDLTITQVERRAMPVAQRGSLVCQLNGDKVSKHTARGTIVISGVTYQIKGICYDHSNKDMEVVAARSSNDKSFMIGQLPNPEPTSFSGSMILDGTSTVRYQFDIRSAAE